MLIGLAVTIYWSTDDHPTVVGPAPPHTELVEQQLAQPDPAAIAPAARVARN